MILATILGSNALVPIGFVKSMLANREWEHIFSYGLYLDDNRNTAFEIAKNRNEDLLFIDSDIVFTPMDVWKMSEHLKDHDIVSGVYMMGRPILKPAIFKSVNDRRLSGENADMREMDIVDIEKLRKRMIGAFEPYEPVVFGEIDACGAGFLGISRKVILDKPFTRFINPVSGKMYGEDMAFCVKAKESGYKIWVDPTIRLGHIKTEIL